MIFHQVQMPTDNEKPSTESVEDFKRQSQAHQELLNELYELRRELHDADELRDKVCGKGFKFLMIIYQHIVSSKPFAYLL